MVPPNAQGPRTPVIRTVLGAPERVRAGTGGYQGVSTLDVFCEDLCMYLTLPPHGGPGGRGFGKLPPLDAQDADFYRYCRLLFGIYFSMPSWIDFLSIFDPNLMATWPPKSTKIHEKSMPRCLPKMSSFFDRFLVDFWCQLRPPDPSKSWFSQRKNRVFQNIGS